jgi:hypothetical protein
MKQIKELTRSQVLALTRWGEQKLRYAVERKSLLHPERVGRLYVYDPAEVYAVSPEAREALDQLLAFCPRTESGRHFTEAFSRWMDLEAAGLIEVHRPVHPATGLQYSQEHWDAQLTPQGMAVVLYIAELKNDGALD